MIAPFSLDATGYHADTKRHYTGRVAELVKLDSPLGESYRRNFLGLPQLPTPEPVFKPRIRSLPLAKSCKHLGPTLGPVKEGCAPCGSKYLCAIHGEITLNKCLTECADSWEAKEEAQAKEVSPLNLLPRSPIRFDHTNLAPHTGGIRGNPSIINYKDGYLFAYRNAWCAANVSLIRLNRDFQPVGEPKQLDLFHPQALSGREDPRLFWHKGKLHVWYTGWMGGDHPKKIRPQYIASVLFARLNNDTFETEDKFFPRIPGRNRWEKNHAYFDYQDETYCVYSIVPHRVLRVFCEEVREVYETPTVTTWPYRYLRGGASPVLHNGEYYHWFHGMQDNRPDGQRLYSVGVCTFEAKPPFKITRITHQPIEIAEKNPTPDKPHVVFPGGAVFSDGRWVLSCGIHDSWSEIHFYTEQDVEAALNPA